MTLELGRLWICVVATAMSLGASSPALAQRPLSGGIIANSAWEMLDDRRGIGFQVYDLLAAGTGQKIEGSALPMQRLTRSLESGEIDLALLPQTAEFDGHSDRICKVGEVQFSLAVSKKMKQVNAIGDLQGMKFARLRGGTHLDSHPKLKGLIPFPMISMKQGFQMLVLDRVAAVTCTMPGCHRAIRSAGLQVDQFLFLPIETVEIHLYATRHPRSHADFASIQRTLGAYCTGRPMQRRFLDVISGFDEG